ncbi:MAG: hypothetical protein O3C40_00180 [Planctomycetota bacterium]|nr:hypothetical protein [Planctomycetota bacterium]
MSHVHHTRVTILIFAVIAAGCSKEDLTGAFDKAKNAVADTSQAVQDKMETTTDQVQEKLNLAGSIELTAGEPIKTDACYVRFMPQGAGRPAVLQLQSYRDADRESFPSVFLQAQVQANSLAELVGEPLSARMFVQREAQGPVLFSEISTPIEFKITSIEEQLVSAELTSAKLRETTTGAKIQVTGKLTAVFE